MPFALAGSYALWVHGAPESTHDVDLVVPEDAVEAAARSLGDARLRDRAAARGLAVQGVSRRRDGRRAAPAQRDPGRRRPSRARRGSEVLGLRIPVLPPIEVVSTKLRALTERYCDFGELLPPGARRPRAARLAAAARGVGRQSLRRGISRAHRPARDQRGRRRRRPGGLISREHRRHRRSRRLIAPYPGRSRPRRGCRRAASFARVPPAPSVGCRTSRRTRAGAGRPARSAPAR